MWSSRLRSGRRARRCGSATARRPSVLCRPLPMPCHRQLAPSTCRPSGRLLVSGCSRQRPPHGPSGQGVGADRSLSSPHHARHPRTPADQPGGRADRSRPGPDRGHTGRTDDRRHDRGRRRRARLLPARVVLRRHAGDHGFRVQRHARRRRRPGTRAPADPGVPSSTRPWTGSATGRLRRARSLVRRGRQQHHAVRGRALRPRGRGRDVVRQGPRREPRDDRERRHRGAGRAADRRSSC